MPTARDTPQKLVTQKLSEGLQWPDGPVCQSLKADQSITTSRVKLEKHNNEVQSSVELRRTAESSHDSE